MSAAALWSGGAVLAIYLLWVHYVAVMRLQMVREAGQLTLGQKLIGYPALMVGLLLDLVVNVVVCTLLFIERPREWTVSGRLWRHSTTGQGWRQRLALLIRTQLLDSADPDGIHRG